MMLRASKEYKEMLQSQHILYKEIRDSAKTISNGMKHNANYDLRCCFHIDLVNPIKDLTNPEINDYPDDQLESYYWEMTEHVDGAEGDREPRPMTEILDDIVSHAESNLEVWQL